MSIDGTPHRCHHEGMNEITTKELHLETKSILDELEKGRSVVITRNGTPIARMEPITTAQATGWDDVMSEVWEAQARIREEERTANPVLKERARRRR